MPRGLITVVDDYHRKFPVGDVLPADVCRSRRPHQQQQPAGARRYLQEPLVFPQRPLGQLSDSKMLALSAYLYYSSCCRITIEQGLLFTRHRKIKTRQENYNIRQDKNLQASTKGWGQSPLKGSLTRRGLARPTSRQSPESFTGKTKGDEHQRPSSQTQSRQDPRVDKSCNRDEV